MKIEKITQQPNFNGKVILNIGTSDSIQKLSPSVVDRRFKQIATMIQDKKYDIFISRNKQNPNFFDVAANKTFDEASKIKEYTVKIQKDTLVTSVVDAARDAMEMYEKYISRNIKG